jgi:sugar lactone lactonase YvrE
LASFAVSIRRACIISIATCLLVLSSAAVNRAYAQAHFVGAHIPLPIGVLAQPYGVAVDANGNIYVADSANNSISKLTPSGVVSSGGPFPTGDGSPYGIAVDAAGNLFVSDNVKNEVVKWTLQAGGYYKKSVLPLKGLNGPMGVAVDAQGNVYVADSQNNRVIQATPFKSTYSQSLVPTSPLSQPEGVAVDASGNLYVADTLHLRVIKETASSSGWTESLVVDVTNYTTRPTGVAVDAAGDVFVLTYLNSQDFIVVKAALFGGVYSVSNLPSGQNPFGIAANAAGDAFIASPGSNQLLKVFAGPASFGAAEVATTSAPITLDFTFDQQSTLSALAVLTQGATGLDFADAGTGSCGDQGPSFVYNAGDRCTVDVIFKPQLPGNRQGAAVLSAGFNTVATAYAFGTGVSPLAVYPPGSVVAVANLASASALAVDGAGNVFVADSSSGSVYKETVSATLPRTYARSTAAQGFSQLMGVALDSAGNVYVATSDAIYKEAPTHGIFIPSRVFLTITSLVAIAADRAGNLYLTSSLGEVHKATLQTNGTYVESAISSGIASPAGLAVDRSGDVFIVDTASRNLYIETLQTNGSYLESTFALGLAAPQSLTMDVSGNLYVADAAHGEIDKLTPQTGGSYLETVARAGVPNVAGLAFDGAGGFYYSQATGSVTMLDVFDVPTVIVPSAKVGTTTTSYQRIENIGNAPLVFPVPAFSTNARIGSPFALNPASTCPIIGISGVESTLDPGGACVYNVSFTPTIDEAFEGLLEYQSNSLNAVPGQDGFLVFFKGAASSWDGTRTTMRVSPNPVKAGLGVTITVTVVDTDNALSFPQGAVTLTDTAGGQLTPLNGGAAVALSNGKAILSTVSGAPGAHTITASYGAGNGFRGSTGQASLTVQP